MTSDGTGDAPRGAGRYAPSPSGDLHVGNLRTALLAWALARGSGRSFVLRIEDLDRVRPGAAQRQLADLARTGLDWDGEPLLQSTREAAHRAVVERLTAAGLTYECYCTRREIRAAASAPHGAPGAYPGTCRDLGPAERAARRAGRAPAVRLRAQVHEETVLDRWAGPYTGAVDDLVLLRNDGRPAYNLAVVLDDAHQGVDQVVRGDDLLPSTPRQAHLADLLGLPRPEWVHVPLVLNPQGQRLAKRDGAVTLADLGAAGVPAEEAVARIVASLGLPGRPRTAQDVLAVLDEDVLPRVPWVLDPREWTAQRTG
ncbi:tRNA glutamyl-Q(34) synthetase GluQRS [Kocuria sp. LUK]|uniref:Glutamyl-Q tRNA(Asp) synthetase n=1 Tax=Kocuria flava TaxID=446860 RepID=A0A2N4T1W3_9MICC|nr:MULTISPECIES: tRNA glutamyl-Q(34) synthetase GluQRS [Kocuria]MCD1146238.1 tRNA glutamyl-Q(34) synthetase GluQRS [Kocuria sp. LUK]PLC12208.1 glutamyl-Q tRNA(Asp) ligase [Kocuria flava]